MAEAKARAFEQLDPNAKVSYTAPLDLVRDTRDILVSVNGETIRIKRGETVTIQRKFLEVLQNAARQEMAAHRAMAQAAKAATE